VYVHGLCALNAMAVAFHAEVLQVEWLAKKKTNQDCAPAHEGDQTCQLRA
jgi:hypothetical protein